MPKVTIPPIISFFAPSFSDLSLTLEQSTPTSSTETRLHDLNIMTIGKFEYKIA